MFRRALILSFLFTLATLAFAIFNYTMIKPEDLAQYHHSKAERSPRILQRQPALQKRFGVRKDFWIPKETGRRHLSMESETSELILIDRNGKIEATELLQALNGEMREDGDLRTFAAQDGTYFYPSHRFMGKDAEFGFFRDGAPYFRGTAEKTNFSFIAKSPCLFADGVEFKSGESLRIIGDHAEYNALFDSFELSPSSRLVMENAKLQCEGPLTFHLQEQMAQTELPFHYEDSEFRIDANGGKLLYVQEKNMRMTPQTIQCEGAVRLSSEENYALADELVYFPETGTLHLFAKGSNRVLFWKSDGSIQISAPEVAARLGEREEIKGIGDVHFTFDLEEEHRIETLFGKYLQ